jgi:tRNA (guanine-N7-)-methyltransferase
MVIIIFKKKIMIGKLKKYSDIKQFPNVTESNLEQHEPVILSNYWKDCYFNHSKNITLELGCGKGECTLNLARKYPDRQFIGIDIKGARIWKGAQIALDENLTNVMFLRMQIEFIVEYFTKHVIDQIWITFRDPHPKQYNKNSHKRLTSPLFLELYKKILKPGGVIHLKTDNQLLYDYTLSTIESESMQLLSETDDLYNSDIEHDPILFQTTFEKKYLLEQISIKYLSFQY